MKIQKAILFGIIAWVLIFFEVSILMFGLKFESQSLNYYLTHLPLLAIIIIICSLFYFKKTKVDSWEGLKLGITFLIIGIVLDSIITIPLFTKDYALLYKIDILIGYATTLIMTTIIGSIRK